MRASIVWVARKYFIAQWNPCIRNVLVDVKQKDEVHWCGWFEFLHPPAISTDQIWLVDTVTVWSILIGWYYDEMSTKSRVKCSYLQVYTFRTRDRRSYYFRRAYPFKSFLVLLLWKSFLNRFVRLWKTNKHCFECDISILKSKYLTQNHRPKLRRNWNRIPPFQRNSLLCGACLLL